MVSDRPESIGQIRQKLARLERHDSFPAGADESALPLGLPGLDCALGGGLALGALHELAPREPADLGASFGFALAIASRALLHSPIGAREILIIETDFGVVEGGKPYGCGLDLFGLSLDRVLILHAPRPLDALWAFEEALKSRALGAVISELPETGAAADLTATRRLSLAVRIGRNLGLLLRHRAASWTTSAMTRWEVAAAPTKPDRFGGFGRTVFELALTKNRRGPCGRCIVSWNHETRTFVPQALSLGLATPASDRPDRAASAG